MLFKKRINCFRTRNTIFIFFSCFISTICFNSKLVSSVNLGVQDKLSKEEFLTLDREVSNFFKDDYGSMSMRNISHDDELYRSIRAFRHTVVLHQFDYFYTIQDALNKSIGSKVNEELCKIQLNFLVKISKLPKLSLPLDAINFLETYGRVQPGYLNGDTYWRGAVSSCERATIDSNYLLNHLSTKEERDFYIINSGSNNNNRDNNLAGRYCIAHMKSKNWPKYDKYFENRLSVKVGLCIPESCHTSAYLNSSEIQESINHLARYNLIEPFNGDNYYIDYLYCLPDEDSPFRQWDLGTKLFVLFSIVWISVLIYTNIKYNERLKTVKKLRNTIDITMIINQRKCTNNNESNNNYNDDTEEDEIEVGSYEVDETINVSQQQQQQIAPIITQIDDDTKPIDMEQTIASTFNQNNVENVGEPINNTKSSAAGGDYQLSSTLLAPEDRAYGGSVRSISPIPSDIEENDGEFNVIRPIVCPKRTTKKQSAHDRNINVNHSSAPTNNNQSQGFDLIKAFSIFSNIDYLFRTRSSEKQTKEELLNEQKLNLSLNTMKRLSQHQLNSILRRTSSSNEALIKELTQQDRNESSKSKVAIVAQQLSRGHSLESNKSNLIENQDYSKSNRPNQININSLRAGKVKKRVDVDFFDGIKVFATSYIVMGHTMMFFFGIVTDLRFANERMFDYTMIAIINTLQIVGLFYIITGALVTYLSFSKQKTKHLLQPTFWVLIIIGRYLRLIPPYLLVFWFTRHVAPYTGSGAFWNDYRTDYEHVRGYCSQQDWRTVLFMSAADVKIPFDCVPQAWYLSNDFRTLFILPFYVIILVLNTWAGYSAIFATILYSTFKLMNVLQEANIDYSVLILWQPHVYSLLTDRLHSVYTRLDVRLSTYLMGVIIGHLLYLYEQKKIKQWPRAFKLYGLKFALTSICLLFLGAILIANPYINQFLPKPNEVDSDTLLMFIPFFKTYMEFCICVVLLLLATGSGYKWLVRLLSSRTSKVLSQISYGVFLCHIEVMFKMPINKFESDYWYLFLNGSYFVILSNIVAFIVYVLYEMPINNIMRQLFKKLFNICLK